jgi:cell division protein FtsI (penicillin-binding protein 3)
LEYGYNRWLHGEEVADVVEKEGMFRTRPEIREERWEFNQHTLHLTLDSTLQHIAESALRKGVERVQGKSGVAIVLHTPTGQILALANHPDFDPNRYRQYDAAQQVNAAVTYGYEPGSTFKIITVAAALNEGIITPTQEFFCEEGRFQVADKVIRDSHPHGNLEVGQVIQKSSNICAAKIGMEMKPAQFHDYITKFGFGAKTRAGLPGEAAGQVLPPEKWTRVDHATVTFGQGILASPLQVVTAINAIANEGEWRPPYVVEYAEDESGGRHTEFFDESGEVLARFGPKAPRRIIDTAIARILTRFMVSVTERGGTAAMVAIPGYKIAGKTGTSQKYDPSLGRYSNSKFWASFVGFAPAFQPVFTALVVVEEPPRPNHYGSKAAAPIFREIMQRALLLMDVAPATPPTVVVTRPATPEMTVDPATFEAIGMQDLD